MPDARCEIGVTLTTLDERLAELWEPGAASVQERLRVIEAARQAGLQTSVMFGPLLPFLSDSQAAIDGLLEQVADLGVDRIWVDALNPRPRVWPAVADLLRGKFPELLQPYRKILFDPPSRANVSPGAAEPHRRRSPSKVLDQAHFRLHVKDRCRCWSAVSPPRGRSLAMGRLAAYLEDPSIAAGAVVLVLEVLGQLDRQPPLVREAPLKRLSHAQHDDPRPLLRTYGIQHEPLAGPAQANRVDCLVVLAPREADIVALFPESSARGRVP